MKKLFTVLGFILLGLYSNSMADTVTSGSVGLLKPSTGVIDTSRSWADKFNSNFDIIASTLGSVLNATQNTMVASSNTLPGVFLLNGNGVVRSSHTVGLLQNGTGVVFSSHTVGLLQNGAGVVATSNTAIPQSVNTFTVPQVFNSSITLSTNVISIGGNEWHFQSTAPASSGILHTDGKRIYVGGEKEGGSSGGVTGNSTFTYIIPYGGSVYVSTREVCGFPGACVNMGHSTWNVVAISAQLHKGSSVAWTRVDLAISTGGKNGLPLNFQFPTITIPTTTTAGYSALSTKITTGVVINAGWTLGVQVSSGPTSGSLPQKLDVLLDIWKKPFE